MVIVYGYKTMFKREAVLERAVCDNCGHDAPQTLCRYIMQFNLFGIPVFQFTKKRGIMCESCGNILPLSREEYRLEKKQFKMQGQ